MAGEPRDILLPSAAAGEALPIRMVARRRVDEAMAALPPFQRAWGEANDFSGEEGTCLLLPGEDGKPALALAGSGEAKRPSLARGALARQLPEGLYRFEEGADELTVLGWLLSAYEFTAYRQGKRQAARLACPPGVDRDSVLNQARAIWLARDLINTPVEDLGPAELAAHAGELAAAFNGQITITVGGELKRQFPLVHAVGRAAPAARAPRLIDIRWGEPDAPAVTLVGKGVCFDTGGLDIKPSSGMLLMKKDMGGAAAALALARMIMAARLKVRLRVLIPAVENSIGGEAMRPSDVIRARNGMSVEIGNTDAEGRLILADALAAAAEEDPALIIDMATLTGAARVALGPRLPPFVTADDELAGELTTCGMELDDPVWRLPLWKPYLDGMKSPIADICNVARGGFGGAITAALFLSKFVHDEKRWLHLDIYGWNPENRPARPRGGEAQAVRALFALLAERYGGKGQRI